MPVYPRFIKRLIDLIVSLVLFVLLFPFLLLITLLLVVIIGNPFFIQRRPGKNGKIFRVIKYRTMNRKRNAAGQLLPDEQRLTTIGKIMRKGSIDELPQLLNVIAGNMSLVGPRPLLVEYLERYTPQQNRRHEVRPGITGWAQVNGRNNIEWDKKFELDVWYVDHISFLLDLKILGMTIRKIFRSENISKEGHATMPYFKGTKVV